MIAYVKGKLIEKSTVAVVIETQGIGYKINISLTTYDQIPQQENIQLYTKLMIKEDSHTLYGFHTKLEREVFSQLISVSGIGANTARMMLSFMNSDEIINAIANEDISSIKSIKGIGIKTAQRVIIDLKDKIIKTYSETLNSSSGSSRSEQITVKNEAISALEVLGYTRKQTEKLIEKLLKEQPSISIELIIKQSLKSL